MSTRRQKQQKGIPQEPFTPAPRTHLQRAAVNTASQDAAPPIVQDVLSSPGQALDTETRAFMEPRFGHDFSGVRVHTDERAAESARAVNALAYTVGQDVVFDKGQYEPGSVEGQKLMAHELTHVMQQDQFRESSGLQNYSMVSHTGDTAEQEAHSIAEQVVSGWIEGPIQVGSGPGATIQRQETSTPETSVPAGKSQAESFVEFEGVTLKGNVSVSKNLKDFTEKFSDYLQQFRDSNQEACQVFANTMKSETHETAKPEIMKAVFKQVWEIGKKKLVKVIGEHVPGLEQVVDLYEAVEKEVERSEKAEKEAALVDFINDHILNVGQEIQKLEQDLKKDDSDILVNLRQAAADSGDEKTFSQIVRDAGARLKAPTNKEILDAMTEEFVRVNESTKYSTVLGLTVFRTGILYLKYIVDRAETKADLVEKTLSSPYAAQIKSLLKITHGSQIDTAELDFTRVIRLEREDLRVMNDTDTLHAGERDPGFRGLGYFARFVKKMPTINVDDIKAANDPIITD